MQRLSWGQGEAALLQLLLLLLQGLHLRYWAQSPSYKHLAALWTFHPKARPPWGFEDPTTRSRPSPAHPPCHRSSPWVFLRMGSICLCPGPQVPADTSRLLPTRRGWRRSGLWLWRALLSPQFIRLFHSILAPFHFIFTMSFEERMALPMRRLRYR